MHEDLAFSDLLEPSAQAGPASIEPPELRDGTLSQHEFLQCIWLEVSPVAALGEVDQRRREAVTADVARAPHPELLLRGSRVPMAQGLVDGVTELAAAGIVAAVGANKEVPPSRGVLFITFEA